MQNAKKTVGTETRTYLLIGFHVLVSPISDFSSFYVRQTKLDISPVNFWAHGEIEINSLIEQQMAKEKEIVFEF